MTEEEILAVKAGEELDRLVAAEVMGEPMPEFTPENALDLQLAGSPVKSPKGNWLCLCRYDEGDIPTWRPLPYSTDISVAWQVVERLMEQYNIKLQTRGSEVWFGIYNFYFDRHVEMERLIAEVVADTAPEAICKAALIAKLEEGLVPLATP